MWREWTPIYLDTRGRFDTVRFDPVKQEISKRWTSWSLSTFDEAQRKSCDCKKRKKRSKPNQVHPCTCGQKQVNCGCGGSCQSRLESYRLPLWQVTLHPSSPSRAHSAASNWHLQAGGPTRPCQPLDLPFAPRCPADMCQLSNPWADRGACAEVTVAPMRLDGSCGGSPEKTHWSVLIILHPATSNLKLDFSPCSIFPKGSCTSSQHYGAKSSVRMLTKTASPFDEFGPIYINNDIWSAFLNWPDAFFFV